MRKTYLAAILLALLGAVLACQAFPSRRRTPAEGDLFPPTAIVAQPSITAQATPTPQPTQTDLPPRAATRTALSPGSEFEVRFHPDGALVIGDLVSIEIIAPPGVSTGEQQVRVVFENGEQASADFGSYGIAGRTQATLMWIWQTAGETPGKHTLGFSVLPGGPAWSETVTLLPREALPFPEPEATWATTETDCCLVTYITGTASERDLDSLLASLDRQALRATHSFGIELAEPLEVTFLPRVLGHGGFASEGVSVSYLDRNYASGDKDIVFHHEMVHVLDSRMGGELRPTLLVEGLAVYLSGGHFKKEPLMQRAAALLPPEPGCLPREATSQEPQSTAESCGLDWYLPLTSLVDNFYTAQHEIGYLQAGALVEYMINTWGWQDYSAFYRDIHSQPEPAEDIQEKGGPQYHAIQAALMAHFSLTFDQLERSFLEALQQEVLNAEMVEDVYGSVLYYDTVRRYQQMLDPSAYFMTAWLPDSHQMQERGIVADFLRRPDTGENLAIEALLLTAGQEFLSANYAQAEIYLEIINQVLDRIQMQEPEPFSVHPLAQDYLSLVTASQQAGYQPQKVSIESNLARVWANATGPELIELQFNRQSHGWGLATVMGN